MKTVRDFKNYYLKKAGVVNNRYFTTDQQRLFWKKLNDLGWEKKEKSPQETSDVDSTAFLSQKEWDDLDIEMSALI